MLFGHNTNITVGGVVYHVQTEDRGASRAFIETTVHRRGQVVHRRTSNYSDLLPLDSGREQALKMRLDDQHRAVLGELRAGSLELTAAPAEGEPASPAT
jgi:hypothetical protein